LPLIVDTTAFRAFRAFRALRASRASRAFRIIPTNIIRVETIERVLLCGAFVVFAPTLGNG
jgi:hypothetical protein